MKYQYITYPLLYEQGKCVVLRVFPVYPRYSQQVMVYSYENCEKKELDYNFCNSKYHTLFHTLSNTLMKKLRAVYF